MPVTTTRRLPLTMANPSIPLERRYSRPLKGYVRNPASGTAYGGGAGGLSPPFVILPDRPNGGQSPSLQPGRLLQETGYDQSGRTSGLPS
jgi:hypothetical protein